MSACGSMAEGLYTCVAHLAPGRFDNDGPQERVLGHLPLPFAVSHHVSHEHSSKKPGRLVFMRIRLVCISWFLDGCLRQGYVGFADLLASRACMEASWILSLMRWIICGRLMVSCLTDASKGEPMTSEPVGKTHRPHHPFLPVCGRFADSA